MNEYELKKLAKEKVFEWVEKANKIYNTNIVNPVVIFSLKGAAAGTANSYQNIIDLNMSFLANETEKFINTTIPHEVAHLVVKKIWPMASTHGKEWKMIMWSFGLEAKRCHNYDCSILPLSENKTKAYCNCKEPHLISQIRVKRIKNKTYSYSCIKCGARLRLEK